MTEQYGSDADKRHRLLLLSKLVETLDCGGMCCLKLTRRDKDGRRGWLRSPKGPGATWLGVLVCQSLIKIDTACRIRCRTPSTTWTSSVVIRVSSSATDQLSIQRSHLLSW